METSVREVFLVKEAQQLVGAGEEGKVGEEGGRERRKKRGGRGGRRGKRRRKKKRGNGRTGRKEEVHEGGFYLSCETGCRPGRLWASLPFF